MCVTPYIGTLAEGKASLDADPSRLAGVCVLPFLNVRDESAPVGPGVEAPAAASEAREHQETAENGDILPEIEILPHVGRRISDVPVVVEDGRDDRYEQGERQYGQPGAVADNDQQRCQNLDRDGGIAQNLGCRQVLRG